MAADPYPLSDRISPTILEGLDPLEALTVKYVASHSLWMPDSEVLVPSAALLDDYDQTSIWTRLVQTNRLEADRIVREAREKYSFIATAHKVQEMHRLTKKPIGEVQASQERLRQRGLAALGNWPERPYDADLVDEIMFDLFTTRGLVHLYADYRELVERSGSIEATDPYANAVAIADEYRLRDKLADL